MKYKKALDVLPPEIIKIIQEYVEGEFLYVPAKENKRAPWGEKSGIKKSLKIRNSEIYKKYLKGSTINDLSLEYYLSDKSIRRIISDSKTNCS